MDFDTDNIKLIDSDCRKRSEWEELICEGEGSFYSPCEFMTFDVNGLELVIDYALSISGVFSYDPGDYWTPPYSDFDLTNEDIRITSVLLDEEEIEYDLVKITDLVKKNL